MSGPARGHSKRKRRKQAQQGERSGGLLRGLRSGFKHAASSVTSSSDRRARRGSWLGTVVTVVLVVGVAALLFYR